MNTGRLAARYVRALAATGGDIAAARGFAEGAGWNLEGAQVRQAIGAIAVGDIGADPLRQVQADFLEYLRPQSLVGRLLDRVRRLAPKTPTVRLTSGAAGVWVLEGDSIPLADGLTFTRDGRLDPLKVAAIAVTTMEAAQRHVGADVAILADLGAATAEAIDQAFLSDGAGDAATPTGILNGAVTVPATGATAAHAAADLGDLFEALPGRTDRAVFITSPSIAARLAMLLPSAAIGLAPGAEHLLGRPLFLSSSAVATSTSDGERIVLLDPDRVEVVGFDTATLKVTTEGSLLMDNNPSMDSTTPTPAQMVSMWQTNSVAMQARVFVNWRANDGVACISSVSYGAA